MKKLCLSMISLLVAGAVIVILMYKPDWTYLACEAARGISSEVKVEQASTKGMDRKEYQIKDLMQDERITFDQSLMLINKENRLKKSFRPVLTHNKDKKSVMNICMVSAYASLVSEVKNEKKDPIYIRCAYRNREMQREVIAQYKETATSVDASEHQAGLALDICSQGYAGEAFIKSETGQYVNSYCWKYGFIIRYPYYGKAETGINYEPWHIRYVGVPHAEIMYKNHLTMEEYMKSLKADTYYKYNDYLIVKLDQKRKQIRLPKHFNSGIISSDNKGNYIITLKYSK